MKTQTHPKPHRPRQTGRHAASSTKRSTLKKRKRATYPVHKRVLLHPLNTFALLCCGVFIVGWTYQVIAATIVSSVIEAPPLQAAAHILTPSNRVVVSSPAVNVTGTCPSRSYVKLAVNGAFGGSAWCDQANTFAILTSLYAGTNTLQPQAFNETDSPGPDSDAIVAIYNPPTPAVHTRTIAGPDNKPSNQPITAAKPLIFSSDFHFQTFSTAKAFSWTVDLEGGIPPYQVKIDWGDTTTSHLTFKTDPIFTVQHRYSQPGYYAAVLTSTDTIGQQQIMQLAALITDTNGQAAFLSNTPPSAGTTSKPVSHLTSTAKWLLLAWPSYTIIVLMTLSFWLGEKREFIQLKIHR